MDGVGNASGCYEIQLTHTGTLAPDPTAPVDNTYLFYGGLLPGVTLTDNSVASQPHGAGSEYLVTSIGIRYDAGAGQTAFSGSISGDSDLDGDGTIDSADNDAVVHTRRA